VARGEILTDIRDGACVVLGERGEILTEEERLIHLLGKEAVEQLPTLADEEYRKKRLG
jgi:hypothetical protein